MDMDIIDSSYSALTKEDIENKKRANRKKKLKRIKAVLVFKKL